MNRNKTKKEHKALCGMVSGKRAVSLLLAVLMIVLSMPVTAFAKESGSAKKRKTYAEQEATVLTETGVRAWLRESAGFISPWYVGQCDYLDFSLGYPSNLYNDDGSPVLCPTVHETIHTYDQLKKATEEYVTPEAADDLLESIAATDVDGKLYVGCMGGVGGPPMNTQVKVIPVGEDAYLFQVATSVDIPDSVSYSNVCTYPVVMEKGKLLFAGIGWGFFYDIAQTNLLDVEIVTASYPESLLGLISGDYCMSSGAGGWATNLTLEDDGTFSGVYSDTDYAYYDEEPETADDSSPYYLAWKNGCGAVEFYCAFNGRIGNIQKISEYEYTAEVTELHTEREPDETEVLDNYGKILRYYTDAYGVAESGTLHFYLPGMPTEGLPEDFLRWGWAFGEGSGDTLCYGGIYNSEIPCGFVKVNPAELASNSVTIHYNEDNDDGIASVQWGSSLFEKDAFTYNRELAAVAAALNAAASDGGGDEERGTGRYIVPAYEALGFEKSCISLYSYPKNELNEKNVKNVNTKDTDFAFSIAMRNMGDFDLVAIVLRGTETAAEGFGDANAYLSTDDFHNYHAYSYYASYKNDVMAALSDFLKKKSDQFHAGSVKFLVAGHSLGGAAANLVAAELNNVPRMGAAAEDIYAFTFGALNSIQEQSTSLDKYGNIWNFFNFYDTFGPYGQGAEIGNIKPTDGASTIYRKFGTIIPFKKDYTRVFKKGNNRYKNHVMASYFDAVSSGIAVPLDKATELYYRAQLSCPIDVEVYDSDGELVCRIVDQAVDEENTYIPTFVGGENMDEKSLLIPNDGTEYTIRIIGTGEGTMNYFVEPFGAHAGEDGVSAAYSNVSIEEGKVMTSVVGGVAETEAEGDEQAIALSVVNKDGKAIAHVRADGVEKRIFSPLLIVLCIGIGFTAILAIACIILIPILLHQKKKRVQKKGEKG